MSEQRETAADVCQKCGLGRTYRPYTHEPLCFECGSDGSLQSDKCRIRELESTVAKLQAWDKTCDVCDDDSGRRGECECHPALVKIKDLQAALQVAEGEPTILREEVAKLQAECELLKSEVATIHSIAGLSDLKLLLESWSGKVEHDFKHTAMNAGLGAKTL